ncbi:TPA: hypothetical protein DIV55_04805 [Patescibacteria group bacterium]|uniref:EamA domain-containing protein n=1 Tax=Candidatus Gottesmanbacteria bacterium GW2011_GWA1_43_11 TaxID=1618436 RepID=A0A0G1EL98_9BACT|nr:MAG: hypothetical protein UV59_C0031G0003 [Candidatus Gottesmanbacteria bacterium GW2011_GWA1_43_11]HCS79031.1 hypothetical protein [Patescibacteria group bacterium]
MKTVGVVYAILSAVFWGLVYTIDQKVLEKTSPFALLFINSVFVLIISLPLLIVDPQSIKTIFSSGRQNLGLIFLAVVLSALANYLIFASIKVLGASIASSFEIAYPFFVILFSALIFKSGINVQFLIGSVLIFLGSLIIIKFS